jgi:hypothetical protein
MKNKSTQIEWLVSEIKKDENQTNLQKLETIKEIKKYKKEDILPQKPKKLTIWQRIKKVLMG